MICMMIYFRHIRANASKAHTGTQLFFPGRVQGLGCIGSLESWGVSFAVIVPCSGAQVGMKIASISGLAKTS